MKSIILGLIVISAVFGHSLANEHHHCDPKTHKCAVCVLTSGPPGKNITGMIEMQQQGPNGSLSLFGELKGLPPNSEHGFHIHESGDLHHAQNPCDSTGGHYNPLKTHHGSPESATHHMGDLGNLRADEHGVATVNMTSTELSLMGQYSVIGRAFVIHEMRDDMGVNEGESKNTGNTGMGIACGVIGRMHAA
ncbi:unnamed protein product [Allacma fusca]|uniref:Superoxide dismutase copper/zinc binding domain-containing protein n=1 Tax=Allacma fusca TaxID=39272 RepID=A0A8J2JJI8_9HEXA|nr:unnamed protein product [Allacma fusca]